MVNSKWSNRRTIHHLPFTIYPVFIPRLCPDWKNFGPLAWRYSKKRIAFVNRREDPRVSVVPAAPGCREFSFPAFPAHQSSVCRVPDRLRVCELRDAPSFPAKPQHWKLSTSKNRRNLLDHRRSASQLPRRPPLNRRLPVRILLALVLEEPQPRQPWQRRHPRPAVQATRRLGRLRPQALPALVLASHFRVRHAACHRDYRVACR